MGITTTVPYYEGGTWFGISQTSKNPELAWEFIKFITTNEEFHDSLAHSDQFGRTFSSNIDFIEKYKADDSFINKVVNQNIYQAYGEVYDKIDGSIVTEYDYDISSMLMECLRIYFEGEISEDEMWALFRQMVETELTEENIAHIQVYVE